MSDAQHNPVATMDPDHVAIEMIPNATAVRLNSTTNISRENSRTDISRHNSFTQLKRQTSSTDVVKKLSDTRIPILMEPESEFPVDDSALFAYSHGISSTEADRLLQIYGRNELPEKTVPNWYIFVSQLWQPMPIMIWIAAIVEAGIQNWIDLAILLFIQFANASISYYEITKSGDAIAALKSQLQAKATVKRDGEWKTVDAALLVPGDMVLLAAGSAIPADCRVNEGQIEVDQAALTGESLPVTMYKGDSCKMGSTVARGEQEGTVEFTGAETFFGKTASLLKVVCIYISICVSVT